MTYRCVLCGRTYAAGQVRYTCPACGPDGVLRVRYEGVTEPVDPAGGRDMWRYRPLLPLRAGDAPPPLPVGATPLLPAGGRLTAALRLPSLHLKDETRNPTGSLKDRASALVAWTGLQDGVPAVACASTGNAASSLAAATAALELPCYLFVPERAPAAKLAQMASLGATVFAVQGDYDAAYDLCGAACDRLGWLNRNTGFHPFTVEGKKTAGLEIWEQLGRRAPDAVFVPAGDGCILGGIGKAFRDLRELGLIQRLPRVFGVQPSGCAPLHDAWRAGADRPAAPGDPAATLADSIAVGRPRNAAMAIQDVRDSGGAFLLATDGEMQQAVQLLGRTTGIFAEPAAAAGLVGAAKAREQGLLAEDETVVAVITGTGLKDPSNSSARAPHPVSVPATLDGLLGVLKYVPGTV